MAVIRSLQFRFGELPGVPRTELDRLNQFFRDVQQALESTTRTIDVSYTGGETIDVACSMKAEHVLLTRCLKADGVVVAVAATAVDWSWNADRLVIRSVGGLTASAKYDLRLLVIGA